MAVYMIGYDLQRATAEDDETLFSALESLGSGYWDCLESTWLVITDKTAEQIRDELKPHLRLRDRLLVMRYGETAAWLGFTDACETWLKDNL